MKNLKRNLLIILLVCLTVVLTVTLSACNIGGKEESTNEHQHSLTEVAEVKATCTENGTEGYYACSGCDKLFADADGSVEIEAPKAIEKLGHSFTNYVAHDNATCTANGTKTAKCDRCDVTDTIADDGSMKGHSLAEAVKENVVDVTCTTDGSYDSVVYCSVCNDKISSETVTVKATGEHIYSTEKERVDATCVATGYAVMACGCGKTETKTLEIDANAHSFGVGELTVAPTCISTGVRTYTCQLETSHTKTEEVAIDSNAHSWGTGVATAATETEAGYVTVSCTHNAEHSFKVYSENANNANPSEIARLFDGKVADKWYSGSGLSNSAYYPEGTNHSLVFEYNASFTLAGYSMTMGNDNVKTGRSPEKWVLYGSNDGEKWDSVHTVDVAGFTEDYEQKSFTLDNPVSYKYYKFVFLALAGGTNKYYACGVQFSEFSMNTVEKEAVHTYSYSVNTYPTYTSKGSLVRTCNLCSDVVTIYIPTVSEDNGYTKLFSGLATRWEYTYDGFTFIVDIEEAVESNNYSFTANEAYNLASGSCDATYNDAGYFSAVSGNSSTTTITVPADTAVHFIIKGAAAEQSVNVSDFISSIKVNYSESNCVISREKVQFTGEDTWVNFYVATLYLEKGVNTVTFSVEGNINIAGVSFDSIKEISIVKDYDTVDLNLMSFNIRTSVDSGIKAWDSRKAALLKMVIDANPSVACFQEVQPNQIDDLELVLGEASYEVLYFNGSGVAVAYKTDDWEKVSESLFWLSDTPEVKSKGWGAQYYRGCYNILLQHKTTGQYLNVFATHLDFNTTAKVNSVKLIMERAAAMNEAAGIVYPTFIAGDFNDELGALAYTETATQYRDPRYYAPITDFCTTCSYWGTADDTSTKGLIDHCFVSAEHFVCNEFEVIRTRDEAGFYPSDHFAVVAKVSLLVPHVHTEVVDEAVAADCTNTGLTEGKHCSTCGEVLVVQTVVDALGHTEEVDAAVAADCINTGLTEGKHCSVCNEVLVAQTVVDALGHTEAVDAAKAPTCTETGLTEGKHCSVCNEVLIAQTAVDATGHSYDNDLDPSCNSCDFVRDVTCDHTEKVAVGEAKEATCTEAGITAGEKCAACGEVFAAQQVINALGHTEVVDAAKAATCTETGLTEGKHCSVCNEVLEAQTVVDALGHTEVVDEAVAADCINTGLTEGKHCSVCNEVLVAQTETDALGHTNATAVIENEVTPTFEAAGSCESVIYCSVCNAEVSRQSVTLPALNLNDYTTANTVSSANVTTTYTYNECTEYSTSVTSANHISVNGVYYSRYDVAKLNDGNVTVSFDEASGYTYHAASEHTLTQISTYGCNLTITGNVVINSSASITFTNGNLHIGTESVIANVTVNSSVNQAILISSGNYNVFVNAGSTLNIQLDDATWNAVRFSHRNSCVLNVYGTLTTNGGLSGNRYHTFAAHEGGSIVCGFVNNGQTCTLSVDGSMTVNGKVTQTSGSKINVGATGNLIVTDTASQTPTVTEGGYAKIGETEYGTAPASSTEE